MQRGMCSEDALRFAYRYRAANKYNITLTIDKNTGKTILTNNFIDILRKYPGALEFFNCR